MPIFANPLALIGLLTVGGLVGIYLLHSRPRRRDVSSLMLWHLINRSQGKGKKIQRIQLPLLFIIEMLILIILVLAATSPMFRNKKLPRLVVLLDNSFSMQAGDKKSPRQRAEEYLRDLLKSQPYSIRFILAGNDVKVIDDNRLSDVMTLWDCNQGQANISKAMTLAQRLGGNSRILVLTDHAPLNELPKGKILWQAFGEYLPNVAITTATRLTHDDKSNVLLKISNYSDKPQATSLAVKAGEKSLLPQKVIRLAPREAKKIRFNLSSKVAAITADLSKDALPYDNTAILLPEKPRKIGAKINIPDVKLKKLIRRAVTASHLTQNGAPLGIVFTDNPSQKVGSNVWRVIIQPPRSKESRQAIVGPFVMDNAHPLCQGVSLDGVIWTLDKKNKMPGTHVITAGNEPLITEQDNFDSSKDIHINLAASASSLHLSPDWPILIHNILAWRIENLPGLSSQTAHIDETIKITLPAKTRQVFLEAPDSSKIKLPMIANTSAVQPNYRGLWNVELTLDNDKTIDWPLAVNATHSGESDLSKSLTGQWGQWNELSEFTDEFSRSAFILGCAALAFLVLHQFMVRQSGGEK